jgi:hypothetical protein
MMWGKSAPASLTIHSSPAVSAGDDRFADPTYAVVSPDLR